VIRIRNFLRPEYLPLEDETKFLEIAKKLDIKNICFAYKFHIINNPPVDTLSKSSILEIAKKLDINLFFAVILDNNKDIKNQITNAKRSNFLTLLKTEDNKRSPFDSKGLDIIYNLESEQRPDVFNYRRSGLNQITCSLAKTNHLAIGFSFSNLLNSSGMLRSSLKGRVSQNFKLCKKYKLNVIAASFASAPLEMRSPHDLKSVLITLGMQDILSKKSIYNLTNLLQQKQLEKDGKKLADGIELL